MAPKYIELLFGIYEAEHKSKSWQHLMVMRQFLHERVHYRISSWCFPAAGKWNLLQAGNEKSCFKIILRIPQYTISLKWKHSRIHPAASTAMGFLLKEEITFSLYSAAVPAELQHVGESGPCLCFAPLQVFWDGQPCSSTRQKLSLHSKSRRTRIVPGSMVPRRSISLQRHAS